MSYDSAMMDMSMLTGSGVSVNIYGEDIAAMQQAAGDIAERLKDVEGVASVDDGMEEAQTAYHVTVDKNAAMAKGFTVAQLYMDISSALTNSTTALSMDMDGITADVVVQTEGGMSPEELEAALQEAKAADGLCFIEVKCAVGARADLGRPTTSPQENKAAFMKTLRG